MAQISLPSIGVADVQTFSDYAGAQWAPTPAPGELDSDNFAATGMSDGDCAFGATCSTGDYSRGTSTGGVGTGGFYAFDHGAGNIGIGVQPATSDFTPGTLTLRYLNNTGSTITDFDIAYSIWVFNDQNRANSVNFEHSADCTVFTPLPSLDFTTTEVADISPGWTENPKAGTVTLDAHVTNGNMFCIRFASDDVSGGGARDEWALDDISLTPSSNLPVELTEFTARADGEAALLSWQTESETNNAGFQIQQRSGERFQDIAFVEGHGTTDAAHTYHYRIDQLEPRIHVFRLKQIDFSGCFEYSPEIETAISLTEAFRLTEAYPNPTASTARFSLSVKQAQAVKVEVLDILGRRVALLFDGSLGANETRTFSIDGTQWTAGLYMYRVQGETISATRRMMLVK